MQHDLKRTTAATPERQIIAWDGPTRLFHWLLVALLAMAWVSRKWGDVGLVWHTWNGYSILVLIVWRLLWGFAGSSTSRFSAFVAWPWTSLQYAYDFIVGRPRHFLGHNPLGGTVVLVMLAMIAGQGVLGLFSYDDHDSLAGGPLSSRVSDEAWAWATYWHLRVFDLLLWVIGLHIAANVVYLVWKRENLIKAMVTGRKSARPYEDMHETRLAGIGRAALCLVLAAIIVFGAIWAAGGKIL